MKITHARRFGAAALPTSTGGWDTGRAITSSIAIIVLGPAILATLRRAARRARYGPVEAAAPSPTLVP